MSGTLEYTVVGRPVAGDATVLSDYSVPMVGALEDVSSVIARDKPPRAKVKLAPQYQHLAPVVERIISFMGEDPSCTSRLAVAAATRFLAAHGRAVSLPVVVPTGGGIQLEWFQSGVGVELEFDADGEAIALLDVDGHVEARAVTGPTDDWLLQTLRFVRRG